jgi:Peptidase family S41/N-terminal domain of Peptidase_S41 in eukaryotic IRBP
MRRFGPTALLLVILACHRPPPSAPEEDVPIDAAKRAWLIDESLQRIERHYLFPAVAARISAAVRAHQRHGDYDGVTSAAAFADRLSAHFFEVAHDRHLSVRFSARTLPPRAPPGAAPPTGADTAEEASARFDNHGFVRAERLDGNIGYLRIDHFGPPSTVGDTLAAALAFVANTDALIIDLRDNVGGYAPTVDLMEGHFRGDTPPRRPVYVLTSPRTISGGEGFAYDLQAWKRVTVVGERTAGAAHFGPIFPLDAHFDMQIAVGQPLHPVTGTNWEGTGVQPDVPARADLALVRARILALEGRVDRTSDPEQGEEVREALNEARAELGRLERSPPSPR